MWQTASVLVESQYLGSVDLLLDCQGAIPTNAEKICCRGNWITIGWPDLDLESLWSEGIPNLFPFLKEWVLAGQANVFAV